MKNIILSVLVSFSMIISTRAADSSTKLTDVHLCCKSCVTGVEKAVSKVDGAKADINSEEGTVTLTGPDVKTVQKAADAMIAAGYFGKSSDPGIKMVSVTGAKGQKVQTLKVKEVHLCCPKCVTAVNHSLENVPGVKANTATKGAKSFEITGDFNDQEVFSALQKSGLTGKVE